MAANYTALTVLLRALTEGPCTVSALVKVSGLQEATVRKWLAFWHTRRKDAKNLIYIETWVPMRWGPAAAYRWGPGKRDAKRPPPKTNAQACRDYQTRKKSKAVHTVWQDGFAPPWIAARGRVPSRDSHRDRGDQAGTQACGLWGHSGGVSSSQEDTTNTRGEDAQGRAPPPHSVEDSGQVTKDVR